MVSSRNRKTHAAPARRQGGELRGVLRVFGILLALLPGLAGVLFAEDWPTHRRDLQRSGVSPERLQLPLTQTWAYRSANPPAPAWTGPAKKNYYATNQVLLKSRLAFDRAFHVAVAGDGLYFGSSVDDTVYRLNPANGRRQWAYTTDGPVRFAPTIESGHVYFGSEDGTVYCLRQADGSLRWSYTAAGEDNRLVPSNGRYVSLWPVRSGVLVSGNVAYFSAGFFPGEGVYICAVDAVTGSDRGANHWRRLRRNDVSLQGYALLSASNLYFPAGRSSPYVFNRSSGLLQGRFGGDVMGTFALLAGDSLINGPSSREGASLEEFNAASRDSLAVYDGGNAMVVTSSVSYLLADDSLTALNRSNRRVIWSRDVSFPYELVLAGDTLFAGGRDEVAAFDSATGETVWSSPVEGRAYGLAVAGGRLFVSTDRGTIHAFGPGVEGRPAFVRGDSNRDGTVDISDAVTVLFHLFRGESSLECEDHADADDNGRLELTDAVYLLDFLFRSGAAPRPPYPGPGRDTTSDHIECGNSP